MENRCVHSCKGLCNALKVAEKQEQAALQEYTRFAAECDYPDVRQLLEKLVAHHQQALALVEDTRKTLESRFSVVDDISNSFP